MAKSSSYGLALACFAIAAAVAGATQYTVGGANGWSAPTAPAEPFNNWAERTRFQIGDSLLFVYPKDKDSVLLVEPADYNACNTSSYVKKFDDGDTVVTLDSSGPLFFISGVDANCRANEKLIVMVLAARSNGTGGSAPAPSTAPPPTASPSPPPPASSTTPPPPSTSSPAPKGAPTTPSPSPPASSPPPPPASAPATAPSTPPTASSPPPAPSAASPAPVSSSTPSPPPSALAGAPPQAPPPPSASSPAPSAHGATANSTDTPAGASKEKNGAALTVATGFASSLGTCILGYAMLAL